MKIIENPEKVKEIIFLNKKILLLYLSDKKLGPAITLLYHSVAF